MSTIFGETPVTTFEELEKYEQEREEAIVDYHFKYIDYLRSCLRITGLTSKVRVKETKDVGVLRIEENRGSIAFPFEIKFYPIKKNGEVSLKSRYVNKFLSWRIKELVSELQKAFEPVGDNNAE